jgi:DNA-directed RNA polymerase subunit RPC12/RpoP
MSAARSKNLTEWVAAAENLVLNSTKKVGCPDCGKPALQVRDVEYGWGHTKGLERYLVCSHCGAYNAVNMRHARPFGEVHVAAASIASE